MAKQNSANPIRLDPTRTTMLRNAFLVDMGKRFRALRGAIWQFVYVEDAFGLRADAKLAKSANSNMPQSPTLRIFAAQGIYNAASGVLGPQAGAGGTIPRVVPLTANAERFRFNTDAEKVEGYRAWLKQQVDTGILEVSYGGNTEQPWTEPYIGSAYKKGLVRAYTDSHIGDTATETLPFVEGGQKAFLDMSFNAPVGQNKLKLLGTRAFTELKGITAAMDQEMSRILADGLANGSSAEQIARNLNKGVEGIERKRARVLARTEIVRAHAEGQLDAFEAMNIEDVGAMAEWSTAHDGLVCPLCSPLEGVVMTVKEARGLIPRHPHCRCAWLPANVGEEKGGTTKTTWAGPEQGLEPPGTAPTGKTTGQVWHKDEVAARLRDSIKAEFPKLAMKDARAASRWAGADVTSISQKLKPGSKAAIEAKKAEAAAMAATKIDPEVAKLLSQFFKEGPEVAFKLTGTPMAETAAGKEFLERRLQMQAWFEGNEVELLKAADAGLVEDKDVLAALASLKQTIEYAPLHKGHLTRWTGEALDDLNVGDEYALKSLTSFSAKGGTFDPKSTVIIIKDGEGRYVGDATTFQWKHQKEVIVPKGKYTVSKVYDTTIDALPDKADFLSAAQKKQSVHVVELVTKPEAKAVNKGVEIAKKKRAAQEAAATAKAERSMKAKVGLVKEKYGLTDDDLLFPPGGAPPSIKHSAMVAYAKKRGLTEWTNADTSAMEALIKKHSGPGIPYLRAKMQALDEVIDKKLARGVVAKTEEAERADALAVMLRGKDWYADVSESHVAFIKACLDDVPLEYIVQMQESGYTIATPNLLTDAAPHLKGTVPRGWEDFTWDAVEGLCNVQDRIVIVADHTIGKMGTLQAISATRKKGTLLHEVGHAIDNRASRAKGFVAEYKKDVAIMSTKDKKVFDYLLQKGEVGQEETFAEMFAALINGKGSLHAEADLERAFPNLYKYMKKTVGAAKTNFVSKRVLSYTPGITEDRLKQLARVNGKSFNKIAKDVGVTTEELKSKIESAIQTKISKSSIMVRTHEETVNKILIDGRFKSQFEVGTRWAVPEDAEEVVNAEYLSMNVSKDIPVDQRPIYGYLADGGDTKEFGEEYAYGNAIFKLKDGVRNRTTFTVGDSLTHGNSLGAASLDRVFVDAIDTDNLNINTLLDGKEPLQMAVFDYTEAQVHGGVLLSDIDTLYVPEGSKYLKDIIESAKRYDIKVKTYKKGG